MKKTFFVSLDRQLIRVVQAGREAASSIIVTESLSPSNAADFIASALRELGFRNGKLILGLPSCHVFFVETNFKKNTAHNLAALRYALEEHLPIDAEQLIPLTIGEVPHQSAIVLDNVAVQDLLTHLGNEHGIVFDSITPVQLLLATHLLREKLISSNCRLLVANSESSDELVFEDHTLIKWKYEFGAKTECDLSRLADEHDESLHILYDAEISHFTPESGAIILEKSAEDLLNDAVASADTIGVDPQFDFAERTNFEFRIGSSGSSVWEIACFAFLVCAFCFAGSFGYQTYCWNQETTQIDDLIRQEFANLMPGQRVNGPVNRLLESELSRQRTANELIAYSNSSSELLSNLEAFLASLPNELPFRFQLISVFPDAVTLHGEVKSLGELDRLKEAFVRNGYEIGTESTYATQFDLVLTRRAVNSKNGLEAIQP